MANYKPGPGRPRISSALAGKRTIKERALKLIDSSTPVSGKEAAKMILESENKGITKVLNFAETTDGNLSVLENAMRSDPIVQDRGPERSKNSIRLCSLKKFDLLLRSSSGAQFSKPKKVKKQRLFIKN